MTPPGSHGVADRLCDRRSASGISRSWRIDANPPVEMFTTTKSASRACRRSIGRGATVRARRRDARRGVATSSAMRGNGAVVDVVQHDLRRREQRGVDEVDEQLRRPLVAAAADDREVRAGDGAFIGRHRTLPDAQRTSHLDGTNARRRRTLRPFTNRGDPWAIETPVEGLRGARRSPSASSHCYLQH